MRALTIVASALITWFVASGIGVAQSRSWTTTTGDVRVTCPLTVGGSFEARTTTLKGRLSLDHATTALAGELSVELKTLDTGISLRNQHMLDNYLEVQRGEDFETAVLSNIDLGSLTAGVTDGHSRFTARLRLHGTTQSVAGHATMSERGSACVSRRHSRFEFPTTPLRIPGIWVSASRTRSSFESFSSPTRSPRALS